MLFLNFIRVAVGSALQSAVPVVAVRGSTEICINQGPPSYELVTAFKRDDSNNCKVMLFSPNGEYFAWANGVTVNIVSTATWAKVAEVVRPKVSGLHFSPKGTYSMIWEPFIVTQVNPQGTANLYIFKSENGELVKAVVHKKQNGWKPQWSADESMFIHNLNTVIKLLEIEYSNSRDNFTKTK